MQLRNCFAQVCKPIEYATGKWACVQAVFQMDRQVMHHVLQSYIPSALIVIISWFSFWLDVDAVPGRVSLCITTLLTLATQSSASRMALPQVSYAKAIDVWMGVSMAFVFGVMIEFTAVNYLSRRSLPRHMLNIDDGDEVKLSEEQIYTPKPPPPPVNSGHHLRSTFGHHTASASAISRSSSRNLLRNRLASSKPPSMEFHNLLFDPSECDTASQRITSELDTHAAAAVRPPAALVNKRNNIGTRNSRNQEQQEALSSPLSGLNYFGHHEEQGVPEGVHVGQEEDGDNDETDAEAEDDSDEYDDDHVVVVGFPAMDHSENSNIHFIRVDNLNRSQSNFLSTSATTVNRCPKHNFIPSNTGHPRPSAPANHNAYGSVAVQKFKMIQGVSTSVVLNDNEVSGGRDGGGCGVGKGRKGSSRVLPPGRRGDGSGKVDTVLNSTPEPPSKASTARNIETTIPPAVPQHKENSTPNLNDLLTSSPMFRNIADGGHRVNSHSEMMTGTTTFMGKFNPVTMVQQMQKKRRDHNRKVAGRVDKVCRFAFPFAFFIFNMVYWPYYITATSSFTKQT